MGIYLRLNIRWKFPASVHQPCWKFPASVSRWTFPASLLRPMEMSSVTAHKADGNSQRHCTPSRWKFPASLLRPDGNFQRHCPKPQQGEFYSIIYCKWTKKQKLLFCLSLPCGRQETRLVWFAQFACAVPLWMLKTTLATTIENIKIVYTGATVGSGNWNFRPAFPSTTSPSQAHCSLRRIRTKHRHSPTT